MTTGRDVVAYIKQWETVCPDRCLEVASTVVMTNPKLAARIIEVAVRGMEMMTG